MAFDNGASRTSLRVGQAAEMLQVSIETLRRWEAEGRLTVTRSSGGQRLVPITEVTRLLAERRTQAPERPIVSGSARNRFPGIVTRIEKAAVFRSLENLMTFPFVQKAVDAGQMQTHGAYFGVAEGSLFVLDKVAKEFKNARSVA